MKKSYKQIKDIIYNNPRADRQDKTEDDKIEDENKRLTLYDENNIDNRMKMIDRIIRAYQIKKLMLKTQDMQQQNIKEEKKTELIARIVKGYNKNRNKIEKKPEQPPLTQSQKRKRKLSDLNSRINSWKGLESFNIDEGINEYITNFRKLYYSNKRLSFREWMNEMEKLIDTL